MEQAHFGGGMFKKKTVSGEDENEKPKSRKDAIQEIIAKSKTAKVTSVIMLPKILKLT